MDVDAPSPRRSLRHRRLSTRVPADSATAQRLRRILYPRLPPPLVPWGSLLDAMALDVWAPTDDDRTLPTRMEVDLLERDVLDYELYRVVMDED